ncbi:MAG: L-ribulose-5-phosphate 4-epimerase [Prolixibacteraceae bacterium]|nr:L-ribulose-5-phosphate 4-epimerase [Prolixibacteraceae bacterium]
MQRLKQEVFEANMLLPRYGLITFTWGNVSAIDRGKGLVVIKPSGVSYETMKVSDMVVVDLSGKIMEGKLKPSSDTDTHLELYRNFKNTGGIVHTHSTWATTFAQAGVPVSAFGTTHADYFAGEVPVTRKMTPEEIAGEYELETGRVIVERFRDINPDHIPGVLVHSHGPFTWGRDALDAVHNAVVLEEISRMAFHTRILMGTNISQMQPELLNKHFFRKHGANAYYGQ